MVRRARCRPAGLTGQARATGTGRRAPGICPGMTTADDHRSGRDQDWTDAEREGLPVLEEQPPGITDENAVEGSPLPGDHPVGVEERGTTELEESRPESAEERAARLRPDVPQRPPDRPGGRLAAGATDPGDGPTTASWEPDDAGLPAEEAAVHVEER